MVDARYAEAVEQPRAGDPAIRLLAENPFGLDNLLKQDTTALSGQFPRLE
jgi:hypothetical protein